MKTSSSDAWLEKLESARAKGLAEDVLLLSEELYYHSDDQSKLTLRAADALFDLCYFEDCERLLENLQHRHPGKPELALRMEKIKSVHRRNRSRKNMLNTKAVQLGSAWKRTGTFKRVVVFSGHMIDAPDRETPRFPPDKEEPVRAAIAARLISWGIGPGDLAICGGARGADILFAEQAKFLDADVRLMISLPEKDFIAHSVELPGSVDWVARFRALKAQSNVWYQHERVGAPPPGINAFERNNIWMLKTAMVESRPVSIFDAMRFWIGPRLLGLMLWDELPSGDGPGGTAHFAEEIRKLGGRVAIINPYRL